MEEIKEKENDWLVGLTMNKDLEMKDFETIGMTADNTQLRSKDYYKDTDFIKETFSKEDGTFDDATFNKFYDNAAKGFQVFNSEAFKQSKDPMLAEMEHSFTNVYAEPRSKVKNLNFEVKKVRNPFLERTGRLGLDSVEDSNLSISEIAQKGRILDYDTGKTLEKSANDSFNLFSDPLVLAEWDEDGFSIDPDNGEKIAHKKGDYKLNQDGALCYETLGKRDASTKTFLSVFDTITDDGSYANEFDIFDADDKEQDISSTLIRASLKYAPVALGAIASGGALPVIASAYLGATALISLAEALPGVYKAFEGIFAGDQPLENKSGTWNTMNWLESKAKSTSFGSSEYSKKNTFSIENFINLISDVSLQLGQQGAVAKIPKYLGLEKASVKAAKTLDEAQKRLKGWNTFEKQLATTYMTITSGGDAYGRAKLAGHSDRSAGLITLGTLVGYQALMNTPYGDWALKGIGLDDMRLAAAPILKKESERLAVAIGNKAIDATTKQGQSFIIKTVSKALSSGLKTITEDPSKLMAAVTNEGIEEVTEELMSDFMMGLGAGAAALGITKEVDTSFEWNDVLSRYAMAAIGGGIGGGIHRIRTPWANAHKSVSKDNDKLINLVWENGAEAINKEIERSYKKGRLVGSKNLSATESTVVGEEMAYMSAKDEKDSQAYKIKEDLKMLVNTYEELLTKSGSVNKDVDTRKALMNMGQLDLAALSEFGLEERVASKIEWYNAQIIDLNSQLTGLTKEDKEFGPINAKIAELQFQKQEILDGKQFDSFFQQGLIAMNSNLRRLFIKADIDEFSMAKYKKHFAELSDYDKDLAKTQYDDYVKGLNDPRALSARNMQLEYAVDMLNASAAKLSTYVTKYGKEYEESRKSTYDMLEKSMSGLVELLDAFDENGIMKEDSREVLVDKDSGVHKDINTNMLLQSGKNNTFEEMAINLSNSLDLLTANGIALDGELADDINSVVKKISLVLNKERQTSIAYHINEILPSAIEFSLLPVAKKYHLDNNSGHVDLIDLERDIKALTPEELLKSTTADDLRTEFNDAQEQGYLEDELDYMNMSDEDVAKEAIKLIANTVSNARSSTDNRTMQLDALTKKASQALASAASNPMYEYLSAISSFTGSNNESTIEFLKNEGRRLSTMTADEYMSNNPERLIKLIEDIDVAFDLMSTFQDSKSANTYGVVLNKYRKKYNSGEEIPLMNQTTTSIMGKDLTILRSKAEYLLKLYNYNSADKLREPKKTAMKFNQMFSELYDSDENSPSALFAKIDSSFPELGLLKDVDLLQEELFTVRKKLQENLASSTIDKALNKQAEALITKVEQTIYRNFQEAIKTNSKEEVLKKIFNGTFFNMDALMSNKTTEMSSLGSNQLSDFDKAMYMLSVFTSDSNEYKSLLRETLSETVTDKDGKVSKRYKFAPLYTQEYPCRIAFAMASDPEAFNTLIDMLADKDTKKRKYPMLSNLLFIEGYHGTGKTSATASLIYSILNKKFGPGKSTVTSIVKRQSEAFKKALGSEDTAYTKDELFAAILGDKTISDFINKDKGPSDSDFLNKDAISALGENTKIGKVIYIDEVTWYDSKEIAILSEWCHNTGRVIISLGDRLQQGAISGIDMFNSARTPVIEYSMRAGSSIVRDNANSLRVITKNINTLDEEPDTRGKIPVEFKKIWAEETKLKYFYDSNGLLTGVKTVDDIKTIEQNINAMLAQKVKPSDIAIIYESEQDPLFAELKNIADLKHLTLIKLGEMQGSEFDYVISTVDVNPPTLSDTNKIVDYVRKINTLLSRAKYGTIVYGNMCLGEVQAEFNNLIKLSDEKLGAFYEERMDSLDSFKPVASKEGTKEAVDPEKSTSGVTAAGTKVIPPTQGSFVQSDLDKAVEDDLLEAVGGKDPAAFVTPGEELSGKEKDDSICLAYSSIVNFGGTEKDGKITIPMSFNDLHYDLQMFRDIETNKFGTYDLEEDKKELLQALDLLKKEILFGTKSVDELSKDPRFAGLFSSIKDDYDLDKVSMRILYTKRDKAFHHNDELSNDYDNKDPYVQQLVLYVPSLSGRPNGIITLAEFGDKPADSMFMKFKGLALAALKNKPYFFLKLNTSAIKRSGISTRFIKKEKAKFTYKELMNDNSWKNMSDVMLFTGNTTRITKSMNVDTDTELITKIDEMVKDYDLNGRPVVFVTKDPSLANKTSRELADIFIQQKINQAKYRLGLLPSPGPYTVLMIPLKNKTLSGQEFFKEYSGILKKFKDDPQFAARRIRTISGQFLGLNMLKNLYEYKNYCATTYWNKETEKYDWPNDKEAAIYSNIKGILAFMELRFGIKGKRIKVGDNYETHIVFTTKDAKGNIVVNPMNEERLNSVVDSLVGSDETDVRKKLYKAYYGSASSFSEKQPFNFSDMITVLYDITKSTGQQLLEADDKKKINSSYALGNLIYVLTESPVAKFKNGFEYHPIYKGTRDSTSGGMNYVEECWTDPNNLNMFSIEGIVIESQRVLVDMSKASTLEAAKEEERKKRAEEKAKKAEIVKKIEEMKLPSIISENIINTVEAYDNYEERISNYLKTLDCNEFSKRGFHSWKGLSFSNGSVQIEMFPDTVTTLDDSKLVSSKKTKEGYTFIFENKDTGQNTIMNYDNNLNLKETRAPKAAIEVLTDIEKKKQEYTKKASEFYERVDKDVTVKISVRNALSLEGDVTMRNMAAAIRNMEKIGEKELNEFKELINMKLDILC